MLTFKLDAGDLVKASAKWRKLGESVGDGIERFLLTEGPSIEREVKQLLSVGGRIKGKGPRGGKLRAHSAPGEAPYVQSGALRASMGYELEIKKSSGSLIVALQSFALRIGAIRGKGAELTYAQDLELGTSTMAARPYLVPTAMKRIASWGAGLRRTVEVIRG